MMDNSIDIEDIVPPTPNIQSNKVFAHVDKASVTSSKLSRKLLKNGPNGCKRKRIKNSPDYKKVKQKVKQVTLLNFLVKTNKVDDLIPLSNASPSLTSPVKVNLLNRFEEIEKKNDINPEIVSKNINTDDCKSENQISSQTNHCVKEVCDEVASMKLSSENKDLPCISKINASPDKLSGSCCDVKLDKCAEKHGLQVEETYNNTDQEISKDIDQTFSWMTDELWENEKENFNLSNFSHEMDVDYNTLPEGKECIKFQVKEFQKDHAKNEIKLIVVAKSNCNILKSCFLRGFWADSIINAGDIVHILNPSKTEKNVIDNQTGFLVVNPDFLISSTAVVSTLFCMRKAVLNHILPQWSSGNNIMMIGSLVHDIFQKSVNNHLTTPAEVLEIVKSVMKKKETLITLCCQDEPASEIEEKVCKYIPNIIDWINKHCSFKGQNTLSDLSITNVEDIEENIWCPKYGIKGKIDMTVKAYSPNQVASKIMPLELKTGRPTYSAEHVGQVNLYSLMMEERSNEVSDGLLLYLRDKAEMKIISTNHNSKRGLIQLRNELASYVYKWVSSNKSGYGEIEDCILPRPINNKRNCERCPYLLPCTVYQKVFSEEKLLEPSHAMKKLVPLSTKHLSDSHMEYFLHWSRLLLLENVTTAEVKAFWTEDAVSREKQGMCLSHMLLDENVPVRQETVGGYFIHTFSRSADSLSSLCLKDSCLKEGDYVAISILNNLHEVAVAMGYIVSVQDQYIELATERNLKTLDRLKGMVFRIDKIVSNSAASCVRNNLMLLMQEEDQANKLRKFIIDKQTPNYAPSLSKQIVLLGRPILKCLNKDQQKAVLKALMAEDYFLIKGMPGTGKTSTIVALVRLLVQMNMSVLLTSYTHSAIDNILLKLKEHVDFVRLGPKYRIQHEILEYSFENLTRDFKSVEEFSRFMKEKRVVATTSLGVNHAIFKLRKFDICIVDEASQINQVACLGPLFYAKQFILVGDDKQLPPLVLNNEARQRGMQESLFQRLQSSVTCIELTLQYRMNREIMRLCNELTYSGSLRCGSEVVANAVLQLNGKSEIKNASFPLWVSSALDNDISKSVCFMNTENYGNDNSEKDSHTEAELVINILQFLIQCKVPHSEIGIIAPYRKQVELIESKLKSLSLCDIEINTVDQYQGRDKDVIIISCARPCNSLIKSEKVGVILDDERRLNVAISRARKKLIFIGKKPILSNYKPFKNLMNCLREDQFLDIT